MLKGILNTPPGGGKTTTVTPDFPAWVVARSREVRCALGSRNGPQSERYVRRLRITFDLNLLLNLAVKKRLEDTGDPIHQVSEILEGAFLASEKEPTVTPL